jgi:Rhodopirellula transposase DDE domain
LEDIKTIVDCHSQTDPSFKTKRLYTRLSARQVREELISQYSYNEPELATAETIRQKLNQLGYYPQRVAKTQPQKKFPKPMTSLNNYSSLTN